MATGAVKLPGRGFFANELERIEAIERRELLLNYLSEASIALLLGVLDQAKCLAASLDNSGAAISPYILLRSILEYGYKITYLTDPAIEPDERIRRTLLLYVKDIREFQRMPQKFRSDVGNQLALKRLEVAGNWYRDITGKDLSTISTKSIMDSVWNAGSELLPDSQSSDKPIYDVGYRTGSVIMHGNSWAIRHFCLETSSDSRGILLTPRLNDSAMYGMLELAARIVQFSFGFVVQFGNTIPATTMNRLEREIYKLATIRETAIPS